MQKKLKHFKPQRYKAHKKPIDKTLIIGIVAALIILAASIALGLYLGKISSTDQTDEPDSSTEQNPKNPYDAYEKIAVSPLAAYPLPRAAYESDEEAGRAILRANGELIRGLCVRLLDEAGAPSYKSEVYRRIYSAESGGFDLAAFARQAEKSGITLTSIFPMHSFKEENKDIKNARQAFEISLLSEVYSQGIGEVVLTGLPSESPSELYSFTKQLKAACPSLAVGILLDTSKAEDTVLCAELDDIFDFLVFDHTGAFVKTVGENTPGTRESEDGEGEVETEPTKSELYLSIESMLSISERFGARVYIDIGDGCDACLKTVKDTLASLSSRNYMLTVSQVEEQ